MPFVDPLAVMLIGLAFGTAIGAFYFLFSARGMSEQVKALVYPAIGVGLFDFMSGFYMSMFWPFPSYVASYNMLFGDPLVLFGLLLIIVAVLAYKDPKNNNLGIAPILIMMLGIYVLVGAYSIVQLKLESGQNLITAMGLYVFDGIGAVLAPLAYIKPNKAGGKSLYYLEFVILGIGTIFALVIGYMALNGHLAHPP
jgi:putative membrane protein